MLCTACNTDVAGGSAFCPKCGAKMGGAAVAAATATPAEKMRAAGPAGAVSTDAEQELWHGGYSAKAMYGSWLLAAVATVVAAIVAVFVPTPITWLVAAVVVGALWLFMLATYLLERWSVDYSLTNQRLVHKKGILRQATNRIEVIDIDDVTFEQGIVERMFGVGTVKVLSSDKSHPELFLRGIDGVQRVADLIDNARRDERRKRGLYVEAV